MVTQTQKHHVPQVCRASAPEATRGGEAPRQGLSTRVKAEHRSRLKEGDRSLGRRSRRRVSGALKRGQESRGRGLGDLARIWLLFSVN